LSDNKEVEMSGVDPSTLWVFWSFDVIDDEADKLYLDRLEILELSDSESILLS